MKRKKTDLGVLLDRHDATARAVVALIDGLSATKAYQQDGKLVSVIDHATRTKSAELLLNFAVGKPVERQQVLTGRVPAQAIDRAQLRETIDQKLAALVARDGVTVAELVAAEKVLGEQSAELTSPISEAEAIAEARRIHGMAP